MPADPPGTPPSWSLVIPVKVLARAKTRLAGLAGESRGALALAMAADTVTAVLACPAAAAVLVVTDDEEARAALSGLGASVIPDGPAAGLNAALRHGAAAAAGRWPGRGTAALAADLPALRPAELGAALLAAAQVRHAFVPDAAGTGTTAYLASPGVPFRPMFGPGSAARHGAAGALRLALPGMASLRRDVDTPADLRDAAGLGLGPRTAELLARLS